MNLQLPSNPPLQLALAALSFLLLVVIYCRFSSTNFSEYLLKNPPLKTSSSTRCDLFTGEWVPDPEAPYYTNSSCWAIHEHQNCIKYGRPDADFLKWRWRPHGCHLLIFHPPEFLQNLRDKSLAFVGDSVARNQMQSLICLLSRVEYPVDISNTPNDYFRRWKYRSHNFTLAAFWPPYLVKSREDDPKGPRGNGLFSIYLDEVDESWTTEIDEFDLIIISSGHWFFRSLIYHENRRITGCHSCDKPDLTDYGMSYAYQRIFCTAFSAILGREKFKRTVFLRTFAPSHFEGGDWNSGGNCLRRRPWRSGENNLSGVDLDMYLAQVAEFAAAKTAGKKRRVEFRLIDVTRVLLLRPDGHPGRYGHWAHENVTLYNDCVHLCLPGPIDALNDLFLEMLRHPDLNQRKFWVPTARYIRWGRKVNRYTIIIVENVVNPEPHRELKPDLICWTSASMIGDGCKISQLEIPSR
ncbi:hypothetical protein Nepgr_005594 [Nepenthes gracilis]|uniref:Trichome birefringence-like N-terminal domain-containing protein n=1 Tax=Nepenthes gracilis TaxID=150966 RepID=A0AAD3S3T2_NEPGR|nr:hypothetical protein Nepgr_005594 [Nepenthes gracilis]